MSQEDYPVDFVLDSIDSIMPASRQPKVLWVLPRQSRKTSLTIILPGYLILEAFVYGLLSFRGYYFISSRIYAFDISRLSCGESNCSLVARLPLIIPNFVFEDWTSEITSEYSLVWDFLIVVWGHGYFSSLCQILMGSWLNGSASEATNLVWGFIILVTIYKFPWVPTQLHSLILFSLLFASF